MVSASQRLRQKAKQTGGAAPLPAERQKVPPRNAERDILGESGDPSLAGFPEAEPEVPLGAGSSRNRGLTKTKFSKARGKAGDKAGKDKNKTTSLILPFPVLVAIKNFCTLNEINYSTYLQAAHTILAEPGSASMQAKVIELAQELSRERRHTQADE